MQVNKNGIAVQTPGKKKKTMTTKKRNHKRRAPNYHLQLRRFVLIDDEAEVEIVVPCFSPILELLTKDGWREIK